MRALTMATSSTYPEPAIKKRPAHYRIHPRNWVLASKYIRFYDEAEEHGPVNLSANLNLHADGNYPYISQQAACPSDASANLLSIMNDVRVGVLSTCSQLHVFVRHSNIQGPAGSFTFEVIYVDKLRQVKQSNEDHEAKTPASPAAGRLSIFFTCKTIWNYDWSCQEVLVRVPGSKTQSNPEGR